MQGRLEGSFPIFPTVFDADGALDERGMREVVEFLAWGKADGTTVLAVASEGFALSDEEKGRVADTVLQAAAGRLPVVVTVNHYSGRVAAELARRAEAGGAAAVMALPPFFGTRPADLSGVRGFYAALAHAVSIPVIIQDHPVLTGVNLSPEFLAGLVKDVPGIRYIKLEAPQSPYKTARIKELLGDQVGVFGGMGGLVLLEELERGACGTMSSAALLELGEVCRLWRQGSRGQARRLFYDKCLPYVNFEIQLAVRHITKEVLWMAGVIASPHVRAPAPVTYDEVTRSQLRRLLAGLDLKVFRYRG
ncbi:MAG: dihydrodipicolinate synthase family protein [Acetobacteraceae bacterium]|nr:dihydrodipicolinate synthase family protein [Acetobacteraceae bacterium]